jgi:Leucine-rich repeat (LRR) protein
LKKLLPLLFLGFTLVGFSQTTAIPDSNFEQALIDLGIDTGAPDGSVPTANISGITSLDVNTKGISSLTGIEDFTALTTLICDSNQLTSLDMSTNTALTTLYCYNNQLTSLDVSKNSSLTWLNSNSNQLTSLDVRNGNNTNFDSFDSTNNPDLSCIFVDVASYSAENWTDIDSASIFVNNEAECEALNTTAIPDTNFEQALIDLGYDTAPINGSVPTANISGVTSLNVINKNISSLTGIEDFTALIFLNCYDNQLISLDVSTNTALTNLGCDSNQLTSLDVSANTALTYLDCYNNQLTSLDVSTNTALTNLYCFSNQLTSLDVSTNTALTNLYCFSNQLTSLDVSTNTALTYFRCDDNQLTSLDLSNNTALTYLDCYNNQLTSLDVSTNTALTNLGCDDNQLTSLDVSNNTALTYLYCFRNQLTSLDVSNNTALTNLYCFRNQLTSLDASNNTALTYLDCDSNQLTSLDVRNGNNTNFTDFYSTNNPNLRCIFVDVASYSTTNWTNIDPASKFVNNEGACGVLSSEYNAFELNVTIHPNPTDNYLFIEGNKNPISISIYNLLGKKVMFKSNTDKIDVKELPSGVYVIRISDGVGQTNRKFIKN